MVVKNIIILDKSSIFNQIICPNNMSINIFLLTGIRLRCYINP